MYMRASDALDEALVHAGDRGKARDDENDDDVEHEFLVADTGMLVVSRSGRGQDRRR